MPNLFTDKVRESWNGYHSLRHKFFDASPLPGEKHGKSYLQPIRSMEDFANTMVRPVEKPFWLLMHNLGFLFKSIAHAIVGLAFLVPTPIALIVAPKSNFAAQCKHDLNANWANTFVSLGMVATAFLNLAMSIILNPVNVLFRAGATVVERISASSEAMCGVKCVNC